MWHHLLHIPMSIIKDKETINNRSYKYECLDISIYEHVNKTAPAALCAIGRISLYEVNFREPRWVYLVDAAPRDGESMRRYAGKILINISLENLISSDELAPVKHLTLREVLNSSEYPQYGHLFMDYDCSSSAHTGSFILPGPNSGEIVRDFYGTVLWDLEGPKNQFGDKDSINLVEFNHHRLKNPICPLSNQFPSVHIDPSTCQSTTISLTFI